MTQRSVYSVVSQVLLRNCADYEFINLNSTTKSTARSFHSSENVLILDEMLLRCASRRPICSTGYKNVLAETYLIRMMVFFPRAYFTCMQFRGYN